ncbi:hypothetical protein SAY87_024767 [Trapa incisa]|uniref:NAC domain-containing protein n=1 Tax=Trapa incisa TaxID=236973 RepID=A0AAN7GPQ8_9MYRT|nr:hypothetical protein SAY87_024767 [Trapa incisa]
MENMVMAFMSSMPIGYRFHPTEEELLGYYLKGKNCGVEEPVCVIPEVDICSWEPDELRQKFLDASVVRSSGCVDADLSAFRYMDPELCSSASKSRVERIRGQPGTDTGRKRGGQGK